MCPALVSTEAERDDETEFWDPSSISVSKFDRRDEDQGEERQSTLKFGSESG